MSEMEYCPYCDKLAYLTTQWGKDIAENGKPYFYKLAVCKECKDSYMNKENI